MAEHVERSRLNHDLRYHFDYIAKFMNFTKDDIHALNALAPILFPCMPYIVETVYTKLCSFDVTKRCITIPSEEIAGFLPDGEPVFTVLPSETELFKDLLAIYLKRILIQNEWNDTFLQYLAEVGELYGNKNYFKELNTEYIHMNALIGFLEHLMIETIWKDDNIDFKKKRISIRAINKLFWIQNNLFTKYYRHVLKENSIANRFIKKH